MSSVAFRFITSLASPLLTLRNTIQEYREKRKLKKELKEELASALEAEIKEYEEIEKELIDIGKRLLPIIQDEEQPSPRQLIEVINCTSQIIKVITKSLILFVHLAKACKQVSEYKAFMSYLQNTNRFMHDFIERMGSAYIEKDTVKINGGFFRFFLLYKKKIQKNVKMGKLSKDEIAFLEKRVKYITRALNQPFLKRHIRTVAVVKWKKSLTQFNKVSKNVTIDAEGMDTTVLNDFISPDLRQLAPFLDKSP
jgi:hypothetical protein